MIGEALLGSDFHMDMAWILPCAWCACLDMFGADRSHIKPWTGRCHPCLASYIMVYAVKGSIHLWCDRCVYPSPTLLKIVRLWVWEYGRGHPDDADADRLLHSWKKLALKTLQTENLSITGDPQTNLNEVCSTIQWLSAASKYGRRNSSSTKLCCLPPTTKTAIKKNTKKAPACQYSLGPKNHGWQHDGSALKPYVNTLGTNLAPDEILE